MGARTLKISAAARNLAGPALLRERPILPPLARARASRADPTRGVSAGRHDTIIACDCSTFSKEVVRLRSLGRGAPKDTWTFSGPPFPQQRALAPFLRDDPIYHSAVRSPYLPRGDLQRSAS